jgi:hypothetical protein
MNRCSLLAAFAMAASVLVSRPEPASAADVCIPQAVTEALASCSGLAPASLAKRTPTVPTSVAPPAAPKPATRPPPVPDPTLGAAAIRRGLANVRSIQLLLSEVQQLETLLSATSGSAGDRPKLLRRLADAYVELEAAYFRKKVESHVVFYES